LYIVVNNFDNILWTLSSYYQLTRIFSQYPHYGKDKPLMSMALYPV